MYKEDLGRLVAEQIVRGFLVEIEDRCGVLQIAIDEPLLQGTVAAFFCIVVKAGVHPVPAVHGYGRDLVTAQGKLRVGFVSRARCREMDGANNGAAFCAGRVACA